MPSMRFSGLCLLACCSLLAGCSFSPSNHSSPSPAVGITGRVHGGQQPVAASTIQLYTVGTTGDGSAATPLLSGTVTTDSGGNFSITGLYNCTSATYVYITATGGQPITGQTNPNLAMMTALGPCTNLSSGTFVMINEVTTVAAVSALAPWMTSPTNVGSASSDAAALANGFTLAEAFADTATGMSPGNNMPTSTVVPTAQIYTLADILAACINTTGGAAGTATTCGQLFTLTTPNGGSAPANTIAALLNIQNNPGQNVASLFGLSASQAPFQPQLTAAPADLRVRLAADASSPGYLQVSPSGVDFGNVSVGFSSIAQSVSVTNAGGGTANVSSFTVVGANASDFAVYLPSGGGVSSDACFQGAVGSGETCVIQVVATPTVAGTRNAFLQVISSSPNSPQLIPLAVKSNASQATPVTVSASSLTFQFAGTWQDITLTNLNPVALPIRNVTLSDQRNFAIAKNDCGSSLAAQSTCTVSVQALDASWDYANTQPVSHTATLTFDSGTASTSPVVTLNSSAYGTVTPNSAGAFAYGNDATYAPTNVHYQSPGYSTTAFGGLITGSTAASYSLSPNTCSITFSLQGPFTCSIHVNYLGGSRTPSGNARLTVGWAFGGVQPSYLDYLPIVSTAASGTAINLLGPSSLSLSRTSGNSPDPQLAGSPTANFGVWNNTTGTTMHVTAGFVGASASEVSVALTGCDNLAPGSRCNGQVTLADGGPLSDSVTLVLKDANHGFSYFSPVSLSRSYAAMKTSVNLILFPNQQTGTTSAPQSVTVSDVNGYSLNHALTAAISAGSPFGLTSPATCAASTTTACSFNVAFAPTGGGVQTGTLVVTDTVSGNSLSVTLSGTGVTGAPALTLSPSPVTFASRAVNTTSVPVPITLTNSGTGNAALTITSVTLTGSSEFSQANSCVPGNLSPGASCTIGVTFSPTAAGNAAGTITVISNASSSPDTVQVTGSAN